MRRRSMQPRAQPHPGSALEVLRVATRLGLTSFGGPIAHLGYFHAEYVVRRKWLDEQTYADLVALCQFLPGPASSQVGMAVGIFRAGLLGGLASWLGFTLPSALALVAFAYGLQRWAAPMRPGCMAQGRGGCRGRPSRLGHGAQFDAGSSARHPRRVGRRRHAGLADGPRPSADHRGGGRLLPPDDAQRRARSPVAPRQTPVQMHVPIGRRQATVAWALFVGLLVGLPFLRHLVPSHAVAMFDSFFRVGSLVFGGGHVVLPLHAGGSGASWLGHQ